MRILICFPGKTDEEIYEPIVSGIEREGFRYSLRIGSAHKSPVLVKQILADDFDLVISGAGLSAALPGVIASETLVPVLGVPCPGAYGGLDSFLSIAQMPPGVPVLCVNADKVLNEAIKIVRTIERTTEKVNLIGESKSADKAIKTLEEMAVEFETKDFPSEGINIVFNKMGEEVEENENLNIYCPDAEHSIPEDAIRSMASCTSGLWVGLNRGENAAIAATQIMQDVAAVTAIRRKYEEKCRTEDGEVRKRT